MPTTAPEAQTGGGDIVVTARRREENISKVPISITALSGESLKQRQVTSEIDLQRSVPGLTIRQSGSSNQFNYALRGQSVDTYSGSPPAVLAYIDEAQIVQQSAGTFYDLEGIQVLKGPQGTCCSACNSTGGAILFQTAKPTDKFGGYLIGRYGNHKSGYVEGAVNVPLGDIGAFRLAGVHNSGGAFVKNLLTGKMLGKKDVTSLRGTLLLRPIDGLTNTTVVQHTWEGGNNIPTMVYSAYACGSPRLHGNNGFTLERRRPIAPIRPWSTIRRLQYLASRHHPNAFANRTPSAEPGRRFALTARPAPAGGRGRRRSKRRCTITRPKAPSSSTPRTSRCPRR